MSCCRSLIHRLCNDDPDYDADEEDWNAALSETLLGADRGAPPVSHALSPVSRYPLRYCGGITFGGVATCVRSGEEVKLNEPHFSTEDGEVVCLEEGPRVYIDHQYDLTYVKTGQHTVQNMLMGRTKQVHSYQTTDREVDLFASPANKVWQRVMELGQEIQRGEDMFDNEWRVDEKLINMTANEVQALANAARDVLASQDIVAEATVPCVVFGDTHGQLYDILLFFREYGWPGKPDGRDFVFNGDFVDRGAHQVEVAMLVLALKVCFPDRVWLVRGNHEDKSVNARYGFVHACNEQFGSVDGPRVFNAFHEAFDQLPLACLVGGQCLVVHGGLGNGNWSLDQLRAVQRPLTHEDINQSNFIFNILWSDPVEDDDPHEEDTFGVHHSPRGKQAVKFGWDVTYAFCQNNNINMIIRSHQAKKHGYGFDVMHEMMLTRVFTARDYEQKSNDGAILLIEQLHDGLLKIRPQVIRSLNKAEEEES